ncbi:ABC transporter ATP-binding protein [Hymenobacter sp. YC55]|uniref:ABC transporter ATP-binding protein n=1 Tax=Hymenobacter sp. YC55 TaxID=3034019 RepID=UPI0023FA0513|nr:ABC transporter ATP-binding protein [Hymenobacter sp. YC55]MDF7810184.1 ABC transporter ATP-binding protein [Hymenobacter sp. YC55]
MSDIAIKVENLGKLYRLGEVGTGTVSHDLNRWWARIRGKEDPFGLVGETNDRTTKGISDYVWSLKDVNFEVKQGEVLGIIGRNGAGKSTLLKLLSKVTTPTTGRIKVNGRIASLLEVGTGFHPELTGRENIFLNGAILGMTKAEIRSKFDEIVDFSGVQRYIDTPVKRYSSGMYVRLAFAVAAFLEPEILIIDEVLAVGDAEFQKKCLGRMKDVSVNDGRTVLFVSHDLGAVQNLCNRSILLSKGVVSYSGITDTAVEKYISERNTIQRITDQWTATEVTPESSLTLIDAKIADIVRSSGSYQIKLDMSYAHFANHKDAFIAIDLSNNVGTVLLQALPTFEKFLKFKGDRKSKIEVIIDCPPLIPGEYYLSFWAGSHNTETIDFKNEIIRFEIIESPTEGRLYPHSANHGYIVPHSKVSILQ